MVSVTRLSSTLRNLLTKVAKASARESGYEQRKAKKLPGDKFVQTAVFAAMRHKALSLPVLANTAAALGVEISTQGIDQRFSPQAAGCLLGVVEEALQEAFSAEAVPVELLGRFSAVLVDDSSVVSLPAELADLYEGCGGRSGQGLAALKLHVRYDLKAGAVRVFLSDGRTQDKASPLQELEPQRGSLRLSDQGFFALEQMARLSEQGAFWLSRLLLQTHVFDSQGQRLELCDFLLRHPRMALDMPVELGEEQRLAARLLAVPVPAEVAAERRRKYRKAARKKGQAPSRRTLALCDWTLLVTNAPQQMLRIHEALVLQRARWQVELLFRLWKHFAQLDKWCTSKPWRILCEFYARLLAVLVQHWCALTSLWQRPDRSLVKATELIESFAMMLASAFRGLFSLPLVLRQIRDSLRLAPCAMNKRKAQPNNYQLLLDPPPLDVPLLEVIEFPATAPHRNRETTIRYALP